jgi:uncharacterized glyoxalase superfamily protein PhnB
MSTPSRSTVVPAMRYRDATAAISFLCRVIGFEKHLVVLGQGGTVLHAQLVLGGGMLMLGSVDNGSAYGRRIRQPDEIGGFETQSAYVVVDDADAVHARAVAEGWSIVRALQDEDYGGRGFTCLDPEGRLWSIGTYDPWASPETAVSQ